MEYYLVLLVMTIPRVQGYYNDSDGTLSRNNVYSNVTSEDSKQNKFHFKEFDKVFQHYRSDDRNREPRFISFQTKDDNIEVEIDFAIPFLSIPVKRSLSGAMGTLQNVISVSF